MKTCIAAFGILMITLTSRVAGEGNPELELVAAARASLQLSIDRYLATKKDTPETPLEHAAVLKTALAQQIEKLETDMNARPLGGEDPGSRAADAVLARKQRLAEEKLFNIRRAIETGDRKLQLAEAIESLEEDILSARSGILGVITMQIDDDPAGKEPFTLGEMLEQAAREYWSAKHRLDMLKKAKE